MKRTEKICPHCKKPMPTGENPWWPFCSERCRTIDLGNWAMGQYRIAGERLVPNDLPREDEDPK